MLGFGLGLGLGLGMGIGLGFGRKRPEAPKAASQPARSHLGGAQCVRVTEADCEANPITLTLTLTLALALTSEEPPSTSRRTPG